MLKKDCSQIRPSNDVLCGPKSFASATISSRAKDLIKKDNGTINELNGFESNFKRTSHKNGIHSRIPSNKQLKRQYSCFSPRNIEHYSSETSTLASSTKYNASQLSYRAPIKKSLNYETDSRNGFYDYDNSPHSLQSHKVVQSSLAPLCFEEQSQRYMLNFCKPNSGNMAHENSRRFDTINDNDKIQPNCCIQNFAYQPYLNATKNISHLLPNTFHPKIKCNSCLSDLKTQHTVCSEYVLPLSQRVNEQTNQAEESNKISENQILTPRSMINSCARFSMNPCVGLFEDHSNQNIKEMVDYQIKTNNTQRCCEHSQQSNHNDISQPIIQEITDKLKGSETPRINRNKTIKEIQNDSASKCSHHLVDELIVSSSANKLNVPHQLDSDLILIDMCKLKSSIQQLLDRENLCEKENSVPNTVTTNISSLKDREFVYENNKAFNDNASIILNNMKNLIAALDRKLSHFDNNQLQKLEDTQETLQTLSSTLYNSDSSNKVYNFKKSKSQLLSRNGITCCYSKNKNNLCPTTQNYKSNCLNKKISTLDALSGFNSISCQNSKFSLSTQNKEWESNSEITYNDSQKCSSARSSTSSSHWKCLTSIPSNVISNFNLKNNLVRIKQNHILIEGKTSKDAFCSPIDNLNDSFIKLHEQKYVISRNKLTNSTLNKSELLNLFEQKKNCSSFKLTKRNLITINPMFRGAFCVESPVQISRKPSSPNKLKELFKFYLKRMSSLKKKFFNSWKK